MKAAKEGGRGPPSARQYLLWLILTKLGWWNIWLNIYAVWMFPPFPKYIAVRGSVFSVYLSFVYLFCTFLWRSSKTTKTETFLKLNNWSNFHRRPWKKIFLLQLTILAALKLTRAKAQNIIFLLRARARVNTDNLISWTAPHFPGHALNKLSSFVYSSS
jgi:hypothetical protein